MKYTKPRSRPRGQKRDKPGVKSLFALPEAGFYRLPELAVRGGCVVTDGCKRVLEFAPDKLCLDFGSSIVTFYGAGLRIESLTGRRLVVAGKIRKIEFVQKWGSADE